METIDLHEFDDEIWLAPKLIVFAGTYERAWRTFGGSQNRSPEQKQTILLALHNATLQKDEQQIAVLAKILENGYGIPRHTLPTLLVRQQAELQQLTQMAA
jgi:hypothetical protein